MFAYDWLWLQQKHNANRKHAQLGTHPPLDVGRIAHRWVEA
jgi:hypothetical protein